jgi:hypothetical protein
MREPARRWEQVFSKQRLAGGWPFGHEADGRSSWKLSVDFEQMWWFSTTVSRGFPRTIRPPSPNRGRRYPVQRLCNSCFKAASALKVRLRRLFSCSMVR